MKTLKTISALVLGSSTLLAVNASAFDAGDFVLRAGTVTVSAQDESDNLVGAFSDSTVTVDDDTQIGISGTYMFTDKIGLEVLAATPFSHDITGASGTLNGADIGSVKHLPPTVSAQYFFMGAKSQWQPYIGLGLNYTTFFSEKVGSDAAAAGVTSIELDDSFGIAASAGIDYMINDNWGINASLMYATISTTATLKAGAATAATVDYDLDPMVYRLNAVYKF